MATIFDVLIIGAGPAGSTLAIHLAKHGWSVAGVEKAEFPRNKVCGEYLSASNLPVFQDLGLADEFRSLAGPQIKRTGIFSGELEVLADMPPLRRNGTLE